MTNEEEARTDMPAPASQVLHGAWDIYSRGDETSPELIAFDFDAAQRDLSDELPHCALIRSRPKIRHPAGARRPRGRNAVRHARCPGQ